MPSAATDQRSEVIFNHAERGYRERLTCRLCNGPLTRVLDLPDTPLANELPRSRSDAEQQDRFPLYLSACPSCGHVQLPVIVDPNRLYRSYVYRSGTSPVFRRHLEQLARDVRPNPGELVVEIGSNDGTLLAEYKRAGFEVLGFDPASNIADIAERENGVPTVRQFFGLDAVRHNWNLHNRKAGLILALNVFAHTDELGDIADGIRELLAPAGRAVIECGYLPDMLDCGVYRVIYHEHVAYWHLRPMCSFLADHGLYVFDAERVQTQGGSMRYHVCRLGDAVMGGAWDVGGRARILADAEAERPPEQRVSELAQRIAHDRIALRAELDQARERGAVVCGYGAPAQLTTTCYALGLTADDIAFIVDDNPLKVGRYTPGTGIPIVGPERLGAAQVCVIFSANFATDIINRHPEFEGEWVIP